MRGLRARGSLIFVVTGRVGCIANGVVGLRCLAPTLSEVVADRK